MAPFYCNWKGAAARAFADGAWSIDYVYRDEDCRRVTRPLYLSLGCPALDVFSRAGFLTVNRVDSLLGRGRRLPRTRVAENENSPLFV